MNISDLKGRVPDEFIEVIKSQNITELRPSQEKSLNAGLLEDINLLVCTPTASGKTLISEIAIAKTILQKKKKAIYVVPLKALATEKYKEFKNRYSKLFKVGISIGDFDSSDSYLATYDLIITTSEKLDSLLRHGSDWLTLTGLIVVDEIHLLNDSERGPTLEIVISMLREICPKMHILGLSATIGNPDELAKWLNAKVVIDNWRPVQLKQGVFMNGQIEFF